MYKMYIYHTIRDTLRFVEPTDRDSDMVCIAKVSAALTASPNALTGVESEFSVSLNLFSADIKASNTVRSAIDVPLTSDIILFVNVRTVNHILTVICSSFRNLRKL